MSMAVGPQTFTYKKGRRAAFGPRDEVCWALVRAAGAGAKMLRSECLLTLSRGVIFNFLVPRKRGTRKVRMTTESTLKDHFED